MPERRIRTLRLAAPEERWIGRGACLVEDALRTASLPWADAGRLLLVRAVDLGTIPAGAAPASVALTLERRLRELAPFAVHAAHPDAPRAAAVWFRDAAEAHSLLAAKLARSAEEPAAWFWPLAVPSWKPGTPPGEALRALLLGALETPAGPAAALELMRTLREIGGLDLLAAALAPADGPWLLRACGWRAPEAGGGALPVVRGREALALARRVEEWGSGDARTAWLAAMLRAVENPARLGDPGLAERGPSPLASSGIHVPPAQRFLPPNVETPRGASPQRQDPPRDHGRSAVAPLSSGGSSPDRRSSDRLPLDPSSPEPSPPDPPSPDPLSSDPLSSSSSGRAVDAARRIHHPSDPTSAAAPETPHGASLHWEEDRDGMDRSASRRNGGDGLPLPPERDVAPPTSMEEPAAGAFTRFAGLFFLLPVLARLGLAGFLEDNPHLLESGFPARLLDHIAGRLGAAPDDPIRRALPLPEGECEGEETALAIWLTSLRRWCRRRARIGLFDLIRRPGQVIATRTHVDVYFDLRHIDMRVRRAGLDLDPGWVPWLGRVVLFHYEPPPEVPDAG